MPSTAATIQVLDTEGVWIGPTSGLNEVTRKAWREKLACFLSFSAEKRPKNGEQFAAELGLLLKNYPVHDGPVLKVKAGVGSARLHRVKLDSIKDTGLVPAGLPEGYLLKEFPAWVLTDTYTSLS